MSGSGARRQAAERIERGVCTKCGTNPAEPDRRLCTPCAERRRASDRARYQAGKAAGALYGGANIDVKRRSGRVASRKRRKARRAAGLCRRCGRRPPVEGGATCGGLPGNPAGGRTTTVRLPEGRRTVRALRRTNERTAAPSAPPAPSWRPSAAGPSARTREAGKDTGNGAPPAAVQTATPPVTGLHAARRAPNARMSAPTSSAASRYGIPVSR